VSYVLGVGPLTSLALRPLPVFDITPLERSAGFVPPALRNAPGYHPGSTTALTVVH
jgi:hypothetical protein